MELGLVRIRALLQRLGDPAGTFPSVVVAGTDGKGSTSAMLARMLGSAGLRVGHYTSPHLVETRERVAIGGELATADALDAALASVQAATAIAPELDPTPFEALTAAALLLFRDASIDVAVLEVGLGGRLDATNATEPVVSVITNLSYDHTAILGDTLSKIAYEKAGVAREGRALVSGQPGLVKAALRKYGIAPRLLTLGVDLSVAHYSSVGSQLRATGALRGPALADDLVVELAMPGRHQFDNAGLAVLAYLALAEWWAAMRDKPLPPVDEVVPDLAEIDWPLRAEVLQTDPLLLADAAHNPAGMQALAALMAERGKLWQVVLAVRSDRDAAELLRPLAPVTQAFFLPRCSNPTLMPAEQLAAVIDQVAPGAAVGVSGPHRCVVQALREANKGCGVVVTGSQHALGEWLQLGVIHSPRLEKRLGRVLVGPA